MSDENIIINTDTDKGFDNNMYRIAVSRDMAIDYGMILPTPEEIEERNKAGMIFHYAQQSKRVRALAALRALQKQAGVTSLMIDLHSVDTDADYNTTCKGCGAGYGEDEPDWPCRTVQVLAKYHDIDLPDDLPGKHYEQEFVPRTVESYKHIDFMTVRPSTFVDLGMADKDDSDG
jgi:hypothetical protein